MSLHIFTILHHLCEPITFTNNDICTKSICFPFHLFPVVFWQFSMHIFTRMSMEEKPIMWLIQKLNVLPSLVNFQIYLKTVLSKVIYPDRLSLHCNYITFFTSLNLTSVYFHFQCFQLEISLEFKVYFFKDNRSINVFGYAIFFLVQHLQLKTLHFQSLPTLISVYSIDFDKTFYCLL